MERGGYDEEEGDDDQEPHPKGVGNNDGQVVRDLLHSYNNHEDMEPKKITFGEGTTKHALSIRKGPTISCISRRKGVMNKLPSPKSLLIKK